MWIHMWAMIGGMEGERDRDRETERERDREREREKISRSLYVAIATNPTERSMRCTRYIH